MRLKIMKDYKNLIYDLYKKNNALILGTIIIINHNYILLLTVQYT